MWRRVSSQLRTLSSLRPTPKPHPFSAVPAVGTASSPVSLRPFIVLTRYFSAATEKVVTKSVEDVMPIATGHEREEIEASLQGRSVISTNQPIGPFGTKEAPAVIKSWYDRRIVGCPGGEDEDEHDVVWFWLGKGESHECPVCTQYFVLDVVGPGGPPDGHGDEDDDHHHGQIQMQDFSSNPVDAKIISPQI